MFNLTGPRFKLQSSRSRNERDLLRLKLLKQNVCNNKLTYYLDINDYSGLIYSILLCFYSVKKINTVNAGKVFFTISWKNRVFYLFFLNLLKQFILIKDLFYHSFRLNAAELLILYKRMIVLDSKIVNLL